jgi:DNA modification methylase
MADDSEAKTLTPRHHNRRLPLDYQRLDTLKLNPKDPRRYTRAERRRFEKFIKNMGPMPMVVTPDRVILSGNVFLEMAIAAGYTEAPVMVAEHLTPAEADAYMLACVRMMQMGEWDDELLASVMQGLADSELKLDLDLTGFELPEIDLILDGAIAGEVEEDPVLPEKIAVTRTGDLVTMRSHRLIVGDALDAETYARLMDGRKAAAVFSDPPFNVKIEGNVSGLGKIKHGEFAQASGEMSQAQFTEFLTQAMSLMVANSVAGSVHILAMDWRHHMEMGAAAKAVYSHFLNIAVWAKDRAGMGTYLRSQHELFFIYQNGKGRRQNNVQLGSFGRDRSNVWQYPSANTFSRGGSEGNLLHDHPTPKPVDLVADAILDVTTRGDIVLDPFMGGGATLIAAEKTGRVAYGIEIDPIFVDVIIRRWRKWTGEDAVFEDGRTFTQVEADRLEAAQ